MYQEKMVLNGQHWISVTDPSDEDIQQLKTKFQLTNKFQSYVKDSRERSRFEYNDQTKMAMLIWQVIVKHKSLAEYQVIPVSFIVIEDTLISILPANASLVNQTLQMIFEQKGTQKTSMLTVLLQLLWQLNDQYIDQIDEINTSREMLTKFHKNPSNQQIKALSSLSNQLVHLTTAIDNNVMAIQQIKINGDDEADVLVLTDKERHLISDVEIETKQSQQMTQDTADLVDRLSNTYNNLLNNTLNSTMRFLTVWSLILAVPPIISGFYGMNMHLPLASGNFAWIGTVIMTVILIIMIVYLVNKRK
ncbi:magnesium transporter CorA family protein [Weissella sagaensis]|jgi:Mg2+ and Co2+ transporter CorA|uniref:magnesium transporter CorA family protein n=1 Tax=Weissella sagaensis TaxID=2559928 RepID=UPI001238A387|nr:magnesium transporter CorA family protein [Weissella sagaensis]KAA8434038.1 magnesium transporter CorA family protein [Weissella paramesenteroides]KAA8438192.1 magnesium transporter CorA family protein [Weissella paramesenteroides]MBU7568046.1 magnesium transporter CorA family protein [Weissella hellenica]